MPNVANPIAPVLLSALLPTSLFAQGTWPVTSETEFRQALVAASPGDTIELQNSIGLQRSQAVTTSVRIKSSPGAKFTISMLGGPSGLTLRGLAPGIPLTFEDLEITVYEMVDATRVVRTLQPVAGEVRFYNVDIRYGERSFQWGGVPIVELEVDEVRLERCHWQAFTMAPNNACIDLYGKHGVGCLYFTGQRLSIQDSDLIASDAIFLRMHPTGCFSGSGIEWTGGYGGAALVANCDLSVLTTSRFTDGNGSTYAPGNWMQWGRNPTPGQPTPSRFVRSGGVLIAHSVSHTTGLPGTVGAPPAPGPTVQVGSAGAQFVVTGNPTPGSSITTSIPFLGRGSAVLVIGTRWGPTPAVGSFLAAELSSSQAVLIPQASSQQWPIPQDPILLGLTVIAQVGYEDTSGAWQLTNPQTFWIR